MTRRGRSLDRKYSSSRVLHAERETRNAERGLIAFAISPPGFEDLVEAELKELGLNTRRGVGGVELRGSWSDLFRANLHCRVASRILLRIAEFSAETFPALRAGLAAVPWSRWLPPRPRLSFRVAKHRTRLYHTGKVAEAARDALAASAGAVGGDAEGQGSLTLYLRLEGERVTVSLDTSGEHLHRRGYRRDAAPAPLRENVAAALLERARWRGDEAFLDPLCGSGTLAIEAARFSLGIPAGWLRGFAFEAFPSFDPASWRRVRAEAEGRIRAHLPAPVFASDGDPRALRLAAAAAKEAGLAEEFQIALAEIEELEPPAEGGLVMTNPPWGLRLKGAEPAYRSLGSALRGPFARWRWAAVVGRPDLERTAGLRPRERHPFRSGGIRLWLAEGGPEAAAEAP
ncbi:MAG: RNA methyltransferase [Deltaproteobacteria bacterium]|nr:RNA methyltransferase [Deltaproteobacteria bacterium]